MISIIIVGFNSKKYLDDCLSSIFKSSYKEYRIIFVDNNSNDGSLDYINNKFPKVIRIDNKTNSGFAGGNNIGIKEAIKLKSDFIFLLNPDTIIDKDCIKILAQSANEYSILQPMILIHKDNIKTNLINTTGSYLNFLGFSYCNDYCKEARNIKKSEIVSASGAGMFLSRRICSTIKLFDENFFMYYEDLDFSWRARIAGFNILLIPEAKIWHKYSFNRNKQKMYFAERNRLIFIYKNFSFKYLLLIFPAFLLNELLILIYSLFSGWLILKLKSYLSFMKFYKKIRKEKSSNENLRTEKGLIKYINAPVSFDGVTNSFFYPYNLFLMVYWYLIRKLV